MEDALVFFETFCKSKGYILTDRIIGISNIYGCTIWQMNYKGLYITDYDIFNSNLGVKNGSLLQSKNMVTIFTDALIRFNISVSLLNDDVYTSIIDLFAFKNNLKTNNHA